MKYLTGMTHLWNVTLAPDNSFFLCSARAGMFLKQAGTPQGEKNKTKQKSFAFA